MFSNILDCPECKHRFMFDVQGRFPEKITCPSCHVSTPYQEFNTLVLCSKCRQKLKIKLEHLESGSVACPLCGERINAGNIIDKDNDLNTYAENSNDISESKKRILQDGEFFDKFKILSFLGKGGMAEVYLAEHLLLKKKCAIKIMSTAGSNDQIFIKRFIREAKIAHSIDNPHIVGVFDAGCDFKTGHMFIAMDYVDGKNLIEVCNGRKMSEQALMDILHTVASALKVLHENNIVHRDIKPSNIMRTKDGIYKLMDLGIAKSNADHQAGEMTLTMDRQTIGTPSYASPEQCQSAHTADIRSDIYSLGATLYHLATGKVPYSGTTTVEIILKVIKHDLVPLKTLRPDLSRGMLNLIEAMMRSNPDERPQTPDALLKFVNTRHYGGSGLKGKMVDFVKSIPETVMDIPTKLGKLSTRIKNTSHAEEIPLAVVNAELSFKDYFLKYLTLAILIAISAVLLMYIRFEYSSKKYTAGREISFFEYAKNGFKTPVVKIKPVFTTKGKRLFMTYPDPEGIFSSATDRTVCFSDDPAHAPDKRFDFSKPETITHKAWKKYCTGNVLDFNSPKINLESTAYLYDKTSNGYTVSVTLSCGSVPNNMLLFSFGNITACKYVDSILILHKNNYVLIPIPAQEYFNIAWSVDIRKRLLIIFSGNTIIGRYVIPETSLHAQQNSNTLQFIRNDIPEFKGFSGKIQLIEFWNMPRSFSLTSQKENTVSDTEKKQPEATADDKEKIKSAATEEKAAKAISEPAQKEQTSKSNDKLQKKVDSETSPTQTNTPAVPPAAVNSAMNQQQTVETPISKPAKQLKPRTISVRLQECRDRLQKVQKQNNYIMKDDTISFIKEQIAELENQAEIRKRVLAAKKKKYSETQTRKFADFLKKFYRPDPKSRPSLGFTISSDIDPNMHIEIDGQKIYLAEIVLQHFSSPMGVRSLILKNVDVNLIKRPFEKENKFFYSTIKHRRFFELCMFGLEDVDSGTYPPAFHMLRRTYYLVTTGWHLSDENLCRFLRLAPNVNAVTPEGTTLMHIAAKYNLPKLAKTLYLAGFTAFDKKDNYNLSPWDTALKFGSSNVADFLESIGKNTKDSAYNKSQIELFQFIRDKNDTYLAELIQSGKCNVHAVGYHGLTAVEYACSLSNIGALQTMKDGKIDITKRAGEGNRKLRDFGICQPIEIAIVNKDIRTLIWLLKNGFSACDSDTRYVLSLTIRRTNNFRHFNETPLDEYTLLNIFKTIAKYDKNLNFNRDKNDRDSVLFTACTKSFRNKKLQLELVTLLLKHKATMDKKTISNIQLDPEIEKLLKRHNIL